jgi:hypothetical protein
MSYRLRVAAIPNGRVGQEWQVTAVITAKLDSTQGDRLDRPAFKDWENWPKTLQRLTFWAEVQGSAEVRATPVSLPGESAWQTLFPDDLPVNSVQAAAAVADETEFETFTGGTVTELVSGAYDSAAEAASRELAQRQISGAGVRVPIMPLVLAPEPLARLQHEAANWVMWLPDNASQQELAATARFARCIAAHLVNPTQEFPLPNVIAFWRDVERLSRLEADSGDLFRRIAGPLPLPTTARDELTRRLPRLHAIALRGLLEKNTLWELLVARCNELAPARLAQELPIVAGPSNLDAVNKALFHRVPPPLPILSQTQDPADFHDYVAAAAQHPPLMLELGLALELRFDAAIPADGRIRVIVQDGPTRTLSKWTRFQRLVAGTSELLLPASRIIDDDSHDRSSRRTIDGGVLDLTNYSLVMLDPHDVYLKVRALGSRVGTGRESQLLTEAGKDSPRVTTAGIALLDDRAALRARAAGTQPGETAYAEDLTTGYRIDARRNGGAWHSLCLRETLYLLYTREGRPAGSLQPADSRRVEGFVTHSTTYQSDTSTNERQASDEVFRWTNWSLAAPVPTEGDREPGYDRNRRPLPVFARHRSVKGTLLWQRFDATYEVRCRAMFLDGSGLTLDECNNLQVPTLECSFTRQEWVVAPTVLLADPLSASSNRAEDVAVLAVRGRRGQPASQTADRYIVPPRVEALLAVHHGYRIRKGLGAFIDCALNPEGSFVSVFEFERGVEPENARDVPPLDRNPIFRDRNRPQHRSTVYYPDPLAYELHAWLFWQRFIGEYPVACHASCDFYRDPLDWPRARAVQIRLLTAHREQRDVGDLRLIAARSSWQGVRAGDEDLLAVFLQPGISARLILTTVPLSSTSSRVAEQARARQAGLALGVESLRWFTGVARGAGISPGAQHTPAHHEIIAAHPMISVPRELEVTHAVDRPVRRPEFKDLRLDLALGQAPIRVKFDACVDLPSTGWLTLKARWTEITDSAEAVPQAPATAVPETAASAPEEENPGITREMRRTTVSMRQLPDPSGDWKRETTIPFIEEQPLEDTRYREITYSLQATSRHRKFYAAVAGAPTESDAEFSEEGINEWRIKALNRGEPKNLEVSYPVPVFRWSHHERDGVRKVVRWGGGLRIYMKRPWYDSTGEDEMMGVLLADGPEPVPPAEVLARVTRWGQDPLRAGLPVPRLPSFGDFRGYATHLSGIPIPPEADPRQPGDASPRALTQAPPLLATVVGYRPAFPDLDKCFCDVEIDPTSSYFPFVSLALARFQPNSLDGFHLSCVTRLDSIQIAPHRWVHMWPEGRRRFRIRMYGYTHGRTAVNSSNASRMHLGTRMKVSVQQRVGGKDAACWLPAVDSSGAAVIQWSEARPWASLSQKPNLEIQFRPSDYFSYWEAGVTLPRGQLGGTTRLLVQEMEAYLVERLPSRPQPRDLVPKPWDQTTTAVEERVVFEAEF